MIFIGYKNNSYYFIYYIQKNVVFHSTYVIFDKKFFSKYTGSCVKECKLYNKLLDKISLETVLSVSESFSKDRPAPVLISLLSISLIQNNSFTHSYSPSLSYKFLSPLPPPVPK